MAPSATSGTGGGIDKIRESSDAELICPDCTPDVRWCDHIQAHVQARRDVDRFWKQRAHLIDDWERRGIGGMVLRVNLPIIPTHGLWAEAAVVRDEVASPWILELHTKHEEENQYNSVRIGITGTSEARKTWRLMVIDYFQARAALNPPKCKSKGHSYPAQVQWTQAMLITTGEGSMPYHLNRWTAWYHELCWHCYKVRWNLATFDPKDDLVPDDPKARTRGGVSYADSAASGSYYTDAEDSGAYWYENGSRS